jgi:hypothetical protein
MWRPQIANELTAIDPLVSDLGWRKSKRSLGRELWLRLTLDASATICLWDNSQAAAHWAALFSLRLTCFAHPSDVLFHYLLLWTTSNEYPFRAKTSAA